MSVERFVVQSAFLTYQIDIIFAFRPDMRCGIEKIYGLTEKFRTGEPVLTNGRLVTIDDRPGNIRVMWIDQ